MSKITSKKYACKKCGYEKTQDTNHYGETYSLGQYNYCPKCSKGPFWNSTHPTTWVCLESEPVSITDMFDEVKRLNLEHDHHKSDLYIFANDETEKLIDSYIYKENVTTFRDQRTGKLMYDIPFAYREENCND